MELWTKTPGLCEEIPTLDYYPAANKTSDAAIIIFPGGAYARRAPHEGAGYAEYLNSIGYDAFVCNYRVSPHRFPLELLDARRAVRAVRYNADKYGISRSKIIVMGSSAGANLATLLCTYNKPLELENTDDIDKEDYMPNGQILCYSLITLTDNEAADRNSTLNLLGEDKLALGNIISPELNVTEKTPPAFMWHVSDDDVSVMNTYMYAVALKQHNVPTEMHIFPFGGHGLGIATKNPHVAQWTELMHNWLKLMFP